MSKLKQLIQDIEDANEANSDLEEDLLASTARLNDAIAKADMLSRHEKGLLNNYQSYSRRYIREPSAEVIGKIDALSDHLESLVW